MSKKQTREEAIENIKAIQSIEKQFAGLDTIAEEMCAWLEVEGKKDASSFRMEISRQRENRQEYSRNEIQKLIKEHHIKSWEIYGS